MIDKMRQKKIWKVYSLKFITLLLLRTHATDQTFRTTNKNLETITKKFSQI